MKKTKKSIEPIKAEFYKLDSRKPVSAEGYKSSFPVVFLLFAIFFCAILVLIIVLNKISGSDNDVESYKIFSILCGVLLGLALAFMIGYCVRNSLVKKRILNSDVTLATIISLSVTQNAHRNKEGDMRFTETLSMTYAFYDREGSLITQKFYRKYKGRNSAPGYYEGQQIVVAFDSEKCFILTKYSLLTADGDDAGDVLQINTQAIAENLSANKQDGINKNKLNPLGYEKKYFTFAFSYGVFFAVFAILLIFFAFKADSMTKWLLVGILGLFCIVFASMALYYLSIPLRAKRAYDNISYQSPTYTQGKLVTSDKVYGNGVKRKYLCVFVDENGNERHLNVKAEVSKILVRRGDTDVIVAYTKNNAVVLVQKN